MSVADYTSSCTHHRNVVKSLDKTIVQSIGAGYLRQLLTAPQCATATVEMEFIHAMRHGWSIGLFGLGPTRGLSSE